jgi:hypothetical protein
MHAPIPGLQRGTLHHTEPESLFLDDLKCLPEGPQTSCHREVGYLDSTAIHRVRHEMRMHEVEVVKGSLEIRHSSNAVE